MLQPIQESIVDVIGSGEKASRQIAFNRVASLQQGEAHVSPQTEDHVWVKQESCISTLTQSRLYNKVGATSPLDVHVSSTSDEVHVPKATRPSCL